MSFGKKKKKKYLGKLHILADITNTAWPKWDSVDTVRSCRPGSRQLHSWSAHITVPSSAPGSIKQSFLSLFFFLIIIINGSFEILNSWNPEREINK